MSHQLSKHLKFRQKYSAARRIFNSLLGVWISQWNTVSCVWYITLTALIRVQFSEVMKISLELSIANGWKANPRKMTLSSRYMGYWPSVRSRWLDIGQVLVLRVYGRDGVEVHKLSQKERSQYPAILTEKAWSIKDLLFGFRENFFRGRR